MWINLAILVTLLVVVRILYVIEVRVGALLDTAQERSDLRSR